MRNEITVFDAINSVLNDDFFRSLGPVFQPPRQVRELQFGGFPHTNIYIDDDKKYVIEIALAGVPKEKIDLEFQNRSVSLKVDLAERDEHGEAKDVKKKAMLQQGIKGFTLIENTWAIPTRFDIEKAEASYKDGMLTIKTPLNEKEERLLERRKVPLIEG